MNRKTYAYSLKYNECRYCGYYACNICCVASYTFNLLGKNNTEQSIVCTYCKVFLDKCVEHITNKKSGFQVIHKAIREGKCKLLEYKAGMEIIHAYTYDYTSIVKSNNIEETVEAQLQDLYKKIFRIL